MTRCTVEKDTEGAKEKTDEMNDFYLSHPLGVIKKLKRKDEDFLIDTVTRLQR